MPRITRYGESRTVLVRVWPEQYDVLCAGRPATTADMVRGWYEAWLAQQPLREACETAFGDTEIKEMK